MKNINRKLNDFKTQNGIKDKGPLSILVQLSRLAQIKRFPLEIDDLLTGKKGQVAQLSGAFLRNILKDHGIARRLTSEGGRTSRGSIALATSYINLLNSLYEDGVRDFAQVERYWVEQVREYFHNLPFHLAVSPAKSFSASINDLFFEVKKRQSEHPGTHFMGIMLQHLVAAKLKIILSNDNILVHGSSVADAPTSREGDFEIGDTVIHCTTSPGAPLMEKCARNIQDGKQPIIITIFERVAAAIGSIDEAGLNGQIEVWDIQQFLSTNIFEHSLVDKRKSKITISKLIDEYNRIIDEVENNPSLKILYGTST